jgi:hypothetical protein
MAGVILFEEVSYRIERNEDDATTIAKCGNAFPPPAAPHKNLVALIKKTLP